MKLSIKTEDPLGKPINYAITTQGTYHIGRINVKAYSEVALRKVDRTYVDALRNVTPDRVDDVLSGLLGPEDPLLLLQDPHTALGGKENQLVVSRNHLLLNLADPENAYLEDLNSKFGTFLDGERIISARFIPSGESTLHLGSTDATPIHLTYNPRRKRPFSRR